VIAAFAFVIVGASGCKSSSGPQPSAPDGRAITSITVTSKSLPPDKQIPVDYTCDGKDVSPELTWSAPPEGTKAIAIVVDDPDASSLFTHWIVMDLPPQATSLAEGADVAALGGKTGVNDFKNVRYNGPCPPRGELHRYRFWVYAADDALRLSESATRADLDAALAGHLLGAGALKATFSH
jgi:Raf kinase inhibitor-like YbhB/YbcL family protein